MNQVTFNLIFGTLMRSAIVAGATWLVAKGALPSDSITEWVGAVLMVGLALTWSIYEKVAAKIAALTKLEVALALPAGRTVADVDAIIKANGSK